MNIDKILAYIRGLLIAGYDDAAEEIIRKLNKISFRLSDQLDALVQSVEDTDRLDPFGAEMSSLLAKLQEFLDVYGDEIRDAGEELVDSSIEAAQQSTMKTTIGATQMLSRGLRWNQPDFPAYQKILYYTSKAAWRAELSDYSLDIVNQIRRVAISGVANGQNPITTAYQIRDMVATLPAYRANTMMRTLQLTAYRDANVIFQVANSGLLAYQIRIATLDDRTCMSCVALHGSRLDIGDRVDDHQNGRCTGVCVANNVEAPKIETGESWFNRQSESVQESMMGPSMFRAWQDNAFDFSQLSVPYQDPVFGNMIREASLIGILGDQAQQYYL
jgi:hypothetical protein